jgi:N-acetylglutamate synthase
MLTIRPFAMEDYEPAYELWSSTPGVGLSDSDGKDSINSFLERNPCLSFVAVDGDGTLRGTVLAGHDGRRGFLYHLAVCPSCRRQGAGEQLVLAALSALRRQNILKCHIMVLEDNIPGQAFWGTQEWLKRDNLLIFSKNLTADSNFNTACPC